MFCVALCDDNEDFLKLEDLVVHQYMEQKHIDCQIEHFKDGVAVAKCGKLRPCFAGCGNGKVWWY